MCVCVWKYKRKWRYLLQDFTFYRCYSSTCSIKNTFAVKPAYFGLWSSILYIDPAERHKPQHIHLTNFTAVVTLSVLLSVFRLHTPLWYFFKCQRLWWCTGLHYTYWCSCYCFVWVSTVKSFLFTKKKNTVNCWICENKVLHGFKSERWKVNKRDTFWSFC